MKKSLRWISRVIAGAALLFITSQASAVLVVVTNGLALTRFDSATPGTVTTVTVTGMQPGEQLIGIDFRPSNGVLYGLGNTKRLYSLNFNSGAATQIGPVGTYNLGGGTFGTSINAVDDVLRFVNNSALNVRVDLDTGALIGEDGGLAAPA
jgi:hypothetical protein